MYNIFIMEFYKVITYGCQMNVHESEKLAGMLEKLGYAPTDDENQADIIVFNTCCVRENAEQRAIGNIGALKPLKKKKKGLIVAVGGCMMQQDGKGAMIKQRFPFVDIIFGTHNLSMFKEYLQKRLSTGKKLIKIVDDDGKIIENVPKARTSYPNAWVNIMYGCNNFCTYCIVPYVRGREKSRNPEDILKEVKSLVEGGYKEITLLGQNVDSYGKTLPFEYDFADLIEEISKIEGKFRLRFMSNHPKDINEKLIKVMASSSKICKSVHLPIQAGSNRVLELMNRRYTQEKYLDEVKMIRSICPEMAITTDIMIGFPTETEEDFLETLKVVNEIEYDGAFTFVYSIRQGTKAAEMDGQVAEDVKKDRIMRLVDRQNEINRQKSLKYVNQTVEVLCEDYDAKKNVYQGRDDKGRMIYFESQKDLIGEFVSVKIVKTGGITLVGEIQGE